MADKFYTNADAPVEVISAWEHVSVGICPECGAAYDRLMNRCTNSNCCLGAASYQ
jgi:hypothetical protein